VIVLRLGFIPVADSEALRADVEDFAEALGASIGDRVKPLLAPDYKSLLTALERNIAQIAWVPPVLAARAVRGGKVVPAAVAVRSGASAYSSALIARAGSPITKLDDLASLRAAWVDRDSAGGYLVIRAALAAAGVELSRAFDSDSFVGTHEEVARAVLERKADVGATYFTCHPGTKSIARAGWRDVADDDAFRIVFSAGPIPADFLGVHASLAGARLEAIQRVLVGGDGAGGDNGDQVRRIARRLFQTDGFARPTEEHLTSLETLLAGLEPPAKRTSVRA
jgi:phosphate/phosphite/phosphonate ABC transporter binding protein